MARVYRAHDLRLERPVAIKALAPAYLLEAEYVERFRREAQRVAALDHPHIVPILHFIEEGQGLYEEGQGLYLVMPLYAESLEERLARNERLSLVEAIQIVHEDGAALGVAHAHGLIHRDVKPGNILLDDESHASLGDFGVARHVSVKGKPDTLTLAGLGLTAGTPRYMAPEQLRGAEIARLDGPITHIGGSSDDLIDATQIAQPTVTASATVSSTLTPTVASGHATATPGTSGVAPSPTPPLPSPVSSPTSTATLPPPLILSALHLTSSGGGQCAGVQTLHNGGTQTITWQWVSVQPSPPPSFVFGINAPAQFGGFPAHLYPGVPPGGSDVLNVRMDCTGQVYTITLRDGFGRTRLVTMACDR
jgi:serine/threonine protein kinase